MSQSEMKTQDARHTRGRLTDRMSIRTRLMLAISTILLLFTLACVLSLANFENVRSARDYAQQADRMLVSAATLGEAINRQEGALRGYVLAGASRYEDTLNRSRQRVEDILHQLQDDSVDNAVQARMLEQIDSLESEWQTSVEGPIMAEVQAGNVTEARNQLVRGVSVAYLDPIRIGLKRYRDDVEAQLSARNNELDHRQSMARYSLLTMLLIGLLVGLFSVRAVLRRVTRPLSQLTDTTQRLAEGERDIQVAFQTRGDEIGAVARALEKFRLIILAQDRASWVRDQRARLTGLLNRSEDDRMLGEQLLQEFVPLVGAGYAALFTPATLDESETRFALLASYGYDQSIDTSFAPGEGLVGSVLTSQQAVVLNDVPDGYLPIRSGLGHAQPKTLLIAPAIVGERVVAVLEIALFRTLNEAERELLDTLLPNIALALLTHARSRRTIQLLGESQDKTRALESSETRLREQQESLKQINAELRTQSEEVNAQAAELRASEEELRVQADEMQAANTQLREQQEKMRIQASELTDMHAQARDRADALSKASQYKSDFLANMSHELRTPLNSLLILSRSLADNDEGNLDGEQIEAARIIHESGTNLLSLINDILDLSKIEAGKMRVVPERVMLATLAGHIERQFSHMARAKGLTFAVTRSDDLPESAVTDAAKVEQVVRNLVSNALKFTSQGLVTVAFARPEPDRVFRSEGLNAHNALAIHVVDEGIGIPADRLEHIFQAFEQVDASTSRNYGGTGLGLSISREFARLLGGEIGVASTEGKGSCFTVYIRLDLAELDGASQASPQPGESARDSSVLRSTANPVSRATASPAVAPAPAMSGAAITVAQRDHPLLLIIDDDATFAKVVAKAARKKGFECETAIDGESGLAMAGSLVPDALVLDLGLPGMDGWSVLDRLKSNPRTQHIPVHIVSAADDTGRSSNAGAIGYIRKPVTREDLDKLLVRAETLSGRKAQRVLVVDDDRDAHAAILQLLRHEATEVISATSGEQALLRLNEHTIDCVVLDLSLPDISGFELLEQIVARAGAPPVVVYSGRDLSAEETARLRAHTDSIVIKGSHAQERLLDEISLFMHRIEDKPSAPVAPTPPRSDEALAGRTVLLVDDDMRNTFALSRLLRGRGLKVLMASDGFKALDQLEASDNVALVLMDIMMPGMDGYETMQRIRAGHRYTHVPIIALTAKAMSGDRDKCIEAGANDYLSKPLDTDLLIDTIKRLI